MKGYLIKDYYLNYKTLIVVAAVQFVSITISVFLYNYSTDTAETTGFMCVLMSFLVFTLAQISSTMLFKNDETKSWVSFSASTPQTYAGQIRSKYIFILTEYAFILLCGIGTAAATSALDTDSFELWSILCLFGVYLIINSIKLPFIFRFGADIGAKGDGMIIGAVLFIAVVYLLFGDISFIDFNDPFGSIVKFIENDGLKSVVIVIFCASLPIYLGSYFISTKVYKKGIENIE